MSNWERGVVVKAPPKSVSFAYPNHFKKQKHPPPLPVGKLVELRSFLQVNSVASSTRRGYSTALNHWRRFTLIYGYDDIPSPSTLSLFVAYIYTLAIDGIDKILSGLSHHFKGRVVGWDAIHSHHDVRRALQGAARLSTKIIKRSPPLLPQHLSSLLEVALAPEATHDDLLVSFIATVGFGALLRLGEMVEPPNRKDRDERKYVKRNSAFFVNNDEFHFRLPYHKADRTYRGSDVVIVSQTSTTFDFVRLARLYISSRDRLTSSSPFLFLRSSGSLPTRKWFLDRLKIVAPSVTGHALRAGGATFYAKIGIPIHIIQRLGRWSSSSFEIYIREHPSLSAAFLIAERSSSSQARLGALNRALN